MGATKADWWIEVERRLAKVTPADLPATPWVLSHTAPGVSMTALGGSFITVRGNNAFLAALKRDVSEGPTGTRGLVVMGDLKALRRVLDEKKERARHARQSA